MDEQFRKILIKNIRRAGLEEELKRIME